MIWLTWRQYRVQTMTTLAALAAIAIFLLVTGLQVRDAYDSTVVGCQADCESAKEALVAKYQTLSYYVTGLMIAVPGIIGVFWGAPLIAREIEAGTHRLVWNQSITRGRWLAVKLGAVGLIAVAVAGLVSLLVTWWASPIDRINMDRFTPLLFAGRAIVPLGYAAFAFTAGACAGLLIRRTVPAMAATLVVFTAVQILVPFAIRPHLMTPERADVALSSLSMRPPGAGGGSEAPKGGWKGSEIRLSGSGDNAHLTVGVFRPGDWVVSEPGPALDAAGREVRGSAGCAVARIDPMECFATSDLHIKVEYQPADRYWTFQWIETGIFLALSGLLAGFCTWWLRRRVA
ncbi:ABC transporter permease subunit [Streptomyces sp. ISL-66]|uniref:ABC transporter permease n=1 Tax=Streptomyces sp. ISL-66 TaxID=2819186 RepID=UPI001BECA13B|nr:ABC transporter permease subunit [Streptomyces sp. ISL-66]MBT2468782.1 ABC transporter permease subunit [Streptomyces sp. ISL-66]